MIVRGPSSRNGQQAADQASQSKGQSVVDSLKIKKKKSRGKLIHFSIFTLEIWQL